jgi:hypothetical protein
MATAVHWFLAWLIFNPEDGGDTFLFQLTSRLYRAISQNMITFMSRLDEAVVSSIGENKLQQKCTFVSVRRRIMDNVSLT